MAKPSILEQCRRRKDEWEIEQIRQVGVRTVEVASRLEKVLEEASTRNGLVYYEGRPLTTGALRRMVGAWCGELDLTLPEGYILAAGPSSSDPTHQPRSTHSSERVTLFSLTYSQPE
jgi:Xaa-Pro aminopeptidase